jgi:lactate dehydrogenase-like 2-hydroxyacid dehydrogenase
MMQPIEERLDQAYTVHRLYDPAQKQAIEAALPSIRAVATGGGSGISNDWIEKMPSLGVIAINGVGTDKVDLKLARSRDIDVTTTPGVLTDDVADLGMALMLAVLPHVPKGDAFGMSVRYWNRSAVADTGWTSCPSPAALAEDSDVLVVCVAASAATRNIVDAKVLKALGRTGVLVNIARGSVIDEDALLAALKDGSIAAAGLDVFNDEPKIREAFFTAPNTVLMPHQGSATVETRMAMGELVLANLAAYFAGEKPPTTVN